MADEEKIIRINVSGDASEFNAEIKRASQAMQDSFKELKFDDLLVGADKQFDNIADKIEAIKDKLKEQRKEVNERYDAKASSGNDAYRNRVEQMRTAENKTFDEAETKLNKFSEAIEKARRSSEKKGDKEERDASKEKKPEDAEGMGSNVGNVLSNMFRKTFGGNFRSFSPQAGLAEGVTGEGAIAGRGGMLGGMGAGGIAAAGALAAVVALTLKGMSDGWEQVRADNKNNAVFAQSFRGDYDASSGMDSNDYAQFALQTARSRGSGDNIGEETIRRAYLKNAFGIEDQDTQQFDKFRFQDGSDPTVIIADILKRSETKGLLGVDKGDFSRIPQVLATVSGLMSMQKNSSEKVDEGYATSLTLAGQRIGGRFADDRLGGVMQGMNAGIQSPQNGGMQAYIFQALKAANPDASFTDILAMQEEGASAQNMASILPGIMRMPEGEMRRMALRQLGMKQQDANRLDKGGNLTEFLEATKGSGKIEKDDQVYDNIKKRSDSFVLEQDKIVENAQNLWRKFWGNLMTDLDTVLKGAMGSTPTGRTYGEGTRFNQTNKPANLNGY